MNEFQDEIQQIEDLIDELNNIIDELNDNNGNRALLSKSANDDRSLNSINFARFNNFNIGISEFASNSILVGDAFQTDNFVLGPLNGDNIGESITTAQKTRNYLQDLLRAVRESVANRRFVVFAPTNDAFVANNNNGRALLSNLEDNDRSLAENDEKLRFISLNHISEGGQKSLDCGTNLSMLSGQDTRTECNRNNQFQIGNGNIDFPQVVEKITLVSNGAIFGVNRVILPRFVPTPRPTSIQTGAPSDSPSNQPSVSARPSDTPSGSPSNTPSDSAAPTQTYEPTETIECGPVNISADVDFGYLIYHCLKQNK